MTTGTCPTCDGPLAKVPHKSFVQCEACGITWTDLELASARYLAYLRSRPATQATPMYVSPRLYRALKREGLI